MWLDLFTLSRLAYHVANDNAPHDPLDYEDFDPSTLPDDIMFDDSANVLEAMAQCAGFDLTF